MFFRLLVYCGLVSGLIASVYAETESVELSMLTLDAAMDEALEKNLGLLTSRYRPANSEEGVAIEAAAFDIELFGSVSLRKQEAAASNSSLDSAAIPESERRFARVGAEKFFSTGTTVTVDSNLSRLSSNNNAARNPDYSSDIGISVRHPLLRDSGRLVNLAPLARAEAEYERSLFLLRADILDVLLETEVAYWNLAHARAERSLIESSLELAQSLLDENQERQRLGLVTPLEVLQSETELVRQQEAIIRADRAIEESEDQLRLLMGSDSFMEPLEDELLVQAMPQDEPELRPLDEVVRDTLAWDVEAKAQEKLIEVQRLNQILAEDDARADLDFTGGVDYLGRDESGADAFRGAYSGAGFDWTVGFEIRFPWGFEAAEARARQARRDLERETFRLYEIKQQRALAARTAWRGVDSGLKRIQVARKSMDLNQETFEQERARYGAGLSAYRRVLEAQRDFDNARNNFLDAIIETIRSAVRLSRVDGSILERHGFTWEVMSDLNESPTLEDFPDMEVTH